MLRTVCTPTIKSKLSLGRRGTNGKIGWRNERFAVSGMFGQTGAVFKEFYKIMNVENIWDGFLINCKSSGGVCFFFRNNNVGLRDLETGNGSDSRQRSEVDENEQNQYVPKLFQEK